MKNRLFFILLIFLLACTARSLVPENVTATVTIVPSRTFSPTITATPTLTPFWDHYAEATPVPYSDINSLPDRNAYAEMALNGADWSGYWMRPFPEDYEFALQNGSDWINHPEQIALRISGYPNPDYPNPREIQLFQIGTTQVSAVLSDIMWDDSIHADQFRIDMELVDGHWVVTWYGLRWQCQPDRGHTDWGIESCH